MTTIKRRSFMAMAAVAALVGFVGAAVAASPDAAAIIRKVDEVEGFRSAYSEAQQIITTTSGKKRTLVSRSWAVGSGDKQLSEFLAPPDIAGQKILMTEDGDNIWMYNPETRRTRKLGSHMRKRRMMGSDFTYEDQGGRKLTEQYTGTLLPEQTEGGVACYVLQLVPTPKGPSYDKLVAWVGKVDYVMRRVDYYKDGQTMPFKRLIAENIKTVGGKKVPHKMTMTNLEDKTETVVIITRIQFGATIPDSVFDSRKLDG